MEWSKKPHKRLQKNDEDMHLFYKVTHKAYGSIFVFMQHYTSDFEFTARAKEKLLPAFFQQYTFSSWDHYCNFI